MLDLFLLLFTVGLFFFLCLAYPGEPLLFLIEYVSSSPFQPLQRAKNGVAVATELVKIGLMTKVDLKGVEVRVVKLASIYDLSGKDISPEEM